MPEYEEVSVSEGCLVRLPDSVWPDGGAETDDNNSIVVYHDIKTGAWDVSLPHMCGPWTIINTETPGQAVAALDEFISALTAARDQIKKMPVEVPDEVRRG